MRCDAIDVTTAGFDGSKEEKALGAMVGSLVTIMRHRPSTTLLANLGNIASADGSRL